MFVYKARIEKIHNASQQGRNNKKVMSFNWDTDITLRSVNTPLLERLQVKTTRVKLLLVVRPLLVDWRSLVMHWYKLFVSHCLRAAAD